MYFLSDLDWLISFIWNKTNPILTSPSVDHGTLHLPVHLMRESQPQKMAHLEPERARADGITRARVALPPPTALRNYPEPSSPFWPPHPRYIYIYIYTVSPWYNGRYGDRGLSLYPKIHYNRGSVISDGNTGQIRYIPKFVRYFLTIFLHQQLMYMH